MTDHSIIHIKGNKLMAKKSVRDLWIIFEPNKKFDNHITSVVTDIPNSHKGSLAHTIKNASCTTTGIWMFHLDVKFTNLTETIQGRFGKVTDCFQSYDNNLQMPITTTSYHEWLKMFNIYSLQRRRERYTIIYIYIFSLHQTQD